jgi:ATP-binding cassette, subfamily B, bacterial MsbA
MIAFLRKLWVFVRPYRLRLLLGLLCGIGFAASNAFLMVAVKMVVNVVFAAPGAASIEEQLRHAPGVVSRLADWLAQSMPSVTMPTSKIGLILVVFTIPSIMLVRGVFSYLNVYSMQWAATRAIADLRTRLFEHLQNLSLSFFHTARTGELISRIISDTQSLHHVVSSSTSAMVRDPITVIALMTLLLYEQPRLTLISMLVLPACMVPIIIYGRKVRRSARATQAHLAELSGLMHESFTGNRIIKAYNLEDTVLERFRAVARKVVSNLMRVVRAHEIPSQLAEFFGAVGVSLVLFYIVLFADRPMTPGDFLQFIGSIFLMYQPIKSMGRLNVQLQQARAASERIFDILDTATTVSEPVRPRPLRAANADIVFESVDFDYGERPVLRGINLTVKAGQLVALVGASGSGKTTVTNLLLRFYDPIRGSVRIGQTDLRDVSLRDLRDQIAVVTQEIILFNDTIRQNIRFGRADASEPEIEAAARHAFAHEFIMDKPEGYEAVIGEKGVALSGGQRQRLAIARAILKDAPILILDEATSALDSESERAVQAALEELMKGRTTLCIAHRLSTVQKADLIVVMDGGRIVESGTHSELLERRGVYWRLYEMQFESATVA